MDRKCVLIVDGKECGLLLTRVDGNAEKIARYDLGIFECRLGHRSYFLLEPPDPKGLAREN
jgi:hypothetical protein